ncbi:protein FAM8A1 isoform X2 [Athalia rosae]|nr:protein FAM8A1 isoform X2 [Athalia rosae]
MAENETKSPSDEESNGDESQPPKHRSTVNERTEYFEKLEKWLQEAYVCQSVAAMFPYYVMSTQMLNSATGIGQFTQVPGNVGFTTTPNVPQANADVHHPEANEGLRQRRPQDPTGLAQPPGAEGFEYRVPPLWKRFFAEFIDFMVLFFLKLSITFIAVDFFDFIDIEHYDLELIQKNLRIDYKMALEMTSGILILELIHRVFVCIFEAIWLQHGINGRIGGATPGKIVMGLRVVQCRNITPIERPDGGDIVFISPG